MEIYMMFGQSYIRNAYQAIKKQYVYIILLILGCVLKLKIVQYLIF